MVAKKNALIRCLGECLQANEQLHAFVLIDPMLRVPFSAELVASCETAVVPARHPSLNEEQRPRLLALNSRDRRLLEASVDQALREQKDPDREASEGLSVGGWLLSRQGIDEVARHLARVMEHCLVQGAGRRFLRLADRRVLESLWTDLGHRQRLVLLGPIQSWVVVNRCGDLNAFSAGDVAQSDPTRMHWSLRADQWERVQRCGIVQAMLRGWRKFLPELPPDYLEQASSAIAVGQRLGLSNQRDLLLLGAYQLQVHPRLCEHPRVIEAVDRARRESTPLFKALERIPDPDGWNDIRQQLGPMDTSRHTIAARN